jgi:hypothetical protein
MSYTTDWQLVQPLVGAQPIADLSTTQNHPLGTRVRARDAGSNGNGEGEFIYVKGVSSGTRGDFVGIDADDYTTTLTVADGVYQLIGVLMSTLDASTKYGWAQIFGKAVANVKASFADNGDLYLTSTPGSLDDADVAGDYVLNAVGASAIDTPETGKAEVQLAYASTDNALDN